MMKNNILPIGLLILFCCAAGCYIDTDTSGFESSDNIASSKKDSLFLNEYELLDKNKKALSVKEAWVEYNWRNETMALGVSKTKIKTGGLQFNIILEDTSKYFITNDFLKTWDIKNNMDKYMGLVNGHCCLPIANATPPDSICLIVSKIDSGLIVSKTHSGHKGHDFEDVVFVKK